jgi:hypothetical protein
MIEVCLMTAPSLFADVLKADGPASDRADKMALYGWLVGNWEMDKVLYAEDGTVTRSDGESHFGWVLQGQAIQDVWIWPKRPSVSSMHGTTLRVYDPGIDAWHIIWSDPVNQDYSRQIGRAEGKDIVQIGTDAGGLQTRWRFTEITPDSFHWLGERRKADGDEWWLETEYFARRMKS